jgi:hypothetical protein
VLRRIISAAAIVSLQVAAISAPFVHAHQDEHLTAHHAGHGVHAHVAGHVAVHHDEADGPHVEAVDRDRATYLAPFVAMRAPAADVLPAITHEVFELNAPVAAYAHRSTELLPGHDPPLAAALLPRAPPSPPAL